MNQKLQAWIQASRAPFFVATIIPLTLGGIVAAKEGEWNTARWLVVFLASFLVHLCANLANDYFEYSSGVDEGDSIGGSRVLQEGKITLGELRAALILLYFAAFLCGVWILWVSKVWWLALLMLFAFISSLFYTAPPFRYGYLGLGEVFVALNMGLIMVVGTSAALTGHYNPKAFWISIPIAAMVALILFYQSLSDIVDDKAAGKFTIAARLGRNRAIWGYRFLASVSVVSIFLLAWTGIIHPVGFVSLLTVVPAYKIDAMIRSTEDWRELHDKGGSVRLFYFINGIILILAAALS